MYCKHIVDWENCFGYCIYMTLSTTNIFMTHCFLFDMIFTLFTILSLFRVGEIDAIN